VLMKLLQVGAKDLTVIYLSIGSTSKTLVN
jgi:hypothetical protein